VTTSAIELSYRVDGPEGAPTIVLLHGFMGCGEDFDHIVTLLGHDRRSVTVDLPGHGRTVSHGGVDGHSMESCAAALFDLIDRLAYDRIDLVGYSMGGRLALNFALAHPERIRHLVLESTSPGLKTESERKTRRDHDAQLAARLQSESFETFLKSWYEQALFSTLTRDRERFRELMERRSKNDPQGLVMSLLGMGTGSQPSLWDELEQITFPTLLIVGERDIKFMAIGREMVSLCAAATLSIVEDAGHNVHFERPDRFAELITGFVTDSTGSP